MSLAMSQKEFTSTGVVYGVCVTFRPVHALMGVSP